MESKDKEITKLAFFIAYYLGFADGKKGKELPQMEDILFLMDRIFISKKKGGEKNG